MKLLYYYRNAIKVIFLIFTSLLIAVSIFLLYNPLISYVFDFMIHTASSLWSASLLQSIIIIITDIVSAILGVSVAVVYVISVTKGHTKRHRVATRILLILASLYLLLVFSPLQYLIF